MTRLSTTLGNLTDLDTDAAEHVQQQLLDAVSLPDGWTVRETHVEPTPDDTGDWFIASFQHEISPDHFVSVFILAGSHRLQLYVDHDDYWTEPTVYPADIEQQLSAAV